MSDKSSVVLASQLAEFAASFQEMTAILEVVESTVSRLENFDGLEESMAVLRQSCLELSRRALKLARVCPAGSN